MEARQRGLFKLSRFKIDERPGARCGAFSENQKQRAISYLRDLLMPEDTLLFKGFGQWMSTIQEEHPIPSDVLHCYKTSELKFQRVFAVFLRLHDCLLSISHLIAEAIDQDRASPGGGPVETKKAIHRDQGDVLITEFQAHSLSIILRRAVFHQNRPFPIIFEAYASEEWHPQIATLVRKLA
jgi:hypothetical protein